MRRKQAQPLDPAHRAAKMERLGRVQAQRGEWELARTSFGKALKALQIDNGPRKADDIQILAMNMALSGLPWADVNGAFEMANNAARNWAPYEQMRLHMDIAYKLYILHSPESYLLLELAQARQALDGVKPISAQLPLYDLLNRLRLWMDFEMEPPPMDGRENTSSQKARVLIANVRRLGRAGHMDEVVGAAEMASEAIKSVTNDEWRARLRYELTVQGREAGLADVWIKNQLRRTVQDLKTNSTYLEAIGQWQVGILQLKLGGMDTEALKLLGRANQGMDKVLEVLRRAYHQEFGFLMWSQGREVTCMDLSREAISMVQQMLDVLKGLDPRPPEFYTKILEQNIYLVNLSLQIAPRARPGIEKVRQLLKLAQIVDGDTEPETEYARRLLSQAAGAAQETIDKSEREKCWEEITEFCSRHLEKN